MDEKKKACPNKNRVRENVQTTINKLFHNSQQKIRKYGINHRFMQNEITD